MQEYNEIPRAVVLSPKVKARRKVATPKAQTSSSPKPTGRRRPVKRDSAARMEALERKLAEAEAAAELKQAARDRAEAEAAARAEAEEREQAAREADERAAAAAAAAAAKAKAAADAEAARVKAQAEAARIKAEADAARAREEEAEAARVAAEKARRDQEEEEARLAAMNEAELSRERADSAAKALKRLMEGDSAPSTPVAVAAPLDANPFMETTEEEEEERQNHQPDLPDEESAHDQSAEEGESEGEAVVDEELEALRRQVAAAEAVRASWAPLSHLRYHPTSRMPRLTIVAW